MPEKRLKTALIRRRELFRVADQHERQLPAIARMGARGPFQCPNQLPPGALVEIRLPRVPARQHPKPLHDLAAWRGFDPCLAATIPMFRGDRMPPRHQHAVHPVRREKCPDPTALAVNRHLQELARLIRRQMSFSSTSQGSISLGAAE